MKPTTSLALLACLALAVGCGSAPPPSVNPDAGVGDTEGEPVGGDESRASKLVRVRAAVREAIDRAPEADGQYPTATLTPEANVTPPQGAIGVGIIDFGAYVGSLTVYRKRVLAHYEPVGDAYDPVVPSIDVPQPVADVLAGALADDSAFASSTALNDLASEFKAKYGTKVSADYKGHGEWLFNALAELTPNAYFLVFHDDARSGHADTTLGSLLCGLRAAGGSERLHSHFATRGESVAEAIQDARGKGLDMRYVNLSAGVEPWVLQRIASDTCPGLTLTPSELDDVQHAYVEFLEAIVAANVVLVQAAVSGVDDEIAAGDLSTLYADCKPIPRRVRVGYAVGARGAATSQRLPAEEWKARRCIDLLVGFGWSDSDTSTSRAFQVSSLGFGHSYPEFVSTSLAAPLGLSVVARYGRDHANDRPEVVAAAFRAVADGAPKVVDILEEGAFLNARTDYVNRLQP